MKATTRLSMAIFVTLAMASCKEKKKINPEDRMFPVLAYLQSQVKDVDTSLYVIRQYIFVDSTRTDTIYIPRDQFRNVAADFLSIPDLSKDEFVERYTETEQYDPTLNRVMISCEPINPEKEIIQSQQVLIKPEVGGDKVTNIIINSVRNSKDSSVQKRLLWKVDESFQVTTIRQLPGEPETISTYKVVWNEDPLP